MSHRTPARGRWIGLAAPVALVAVVVVLYWPSFTLPLSFDDAWSIRLVQDFSLTDLFTRTANFGYYRPLYLAYYRLAALAGGHGPALLHALCIAAHAINTLVLLRLVPALLGRSVAGSPSALAFATALLFALNPFAVQAVALPAGLNHLLALLFIQLATLAYIRARADAARTAPGWMLACLGLCALAFLSNEIGLCVAGFCLVAELARASRARTWPRAAWSFALVAALCAAYAALYLLIPKGDSPEFVFTLEGMLQRAAIGLHTLAYPIVAALGAIGVAPGPAALLAVVITLASCALAARARPASTLIGLGLFLVAVTLPILRLPTGYIENSPRVFYVSTPGVALTWASILFVLGAALTRATRRQSAGAVASGVGLAAIGVIGAVHVSDQIALYARANEPVAAIARAGAELAPDQTLLALNAPEWVSVPSRRFPLFSEGAIVLAPYVDGRDLVLANTGQARDVQLARFQLPADSTVGYAFQTFGAEFVPAPPASAYYTAARVLSTHYLSQTLRTDWVGGVAPEAPAAVEARFGDGLALAQHHVMPCRDGWVVALQWRALEAAGALTPTLSAFAQVLGADGAKLAQGDGVPLQGLLPFDQLPRDRDMIDRRVLLAPGADAATLSLGIYDYVTGTRLPAYDGQGQAMPGDALSIALPPRDPGVLCR